MKKMTNKMLSALLVFVMLCSIVGCSKKDTEDTNGNGTPNTNTGTPTDSKEGSLIPGTYSADVTGMHDFTVLVTVSANSIEKIEIENCKETEGIGMPVVESLPGQIIELQGLGIDAVAGVTLTSNAILDGVEQALRQAGADDAYIEQLKAVTPQAAEKSTDETLTADVIVIGGGGAGMAAAVQAHQDGASVILIEKMSKVGGNTILAGGAMNAVDDGSETALANNDSVELHYTQTYEGGDKMGDPALVRTMVENAWSAVEWLKGMGMKFQDGVFTVTGGLWPRAHKPSDPVGTGFFNTYNAYIDSHDNIKVILNTKATAIEMNAEGRVDTVIATGETGNTITLKANKGVVLATGGFGQNIELREKYNTIWPTLGENVPSTNHPGATGDAIPMLETLGANLVQMENIQLLPLGDPKSGALSGNIEKDVERRIFINKEGNRFVDEGGRRDVMTKALFEQTDNYMWIVLDAHCYPTGDELNNFNESPNELVAAGRAVKADTLEELAQKMGVPAENLIASVEEFNAHVASGEADEFGRTLYSTPIDQAPYYAGPRVPTVHHTMGGVQINTDAQVIDTNGNVIPGLYAAGEVTGGIHGTNRLGGNALTDIAVFGRIAGKSAAVGK